MARRWFRRLVAPPEPLSRIIGPIVGWRGPGAARLIVGLPARDLAWLECRVEIASHGARSLRATPGHGLFRVFAFELDGLPEDVECRYRFSGPAGALDLEGLAPDDLRFRAPGAFAADDALVLLSCHNPFATERGSAEEGWSMWAALLDRIEADPGLRCLVLGGDQVYCDDVEDELLGGLAGAEDDPVTLDRLRRRFIEQYQSYWGHPAYRRVLARIPSVAMWDDHDITDGWGGRPESFDGEGRLRRHWRSYFEVAREAFAAYQSSRNPPPLPGLPGGCFSTAVDLGESRLWLLDLRSERDASERRLWSEPHERTVLGSIHAAPESVRAALVLSPVVPFRTNVEEDRRLTRWSRALFGVVDWLENHRDLRAALGPLRWSSFLLLATAVVLDLTVTHWPLASFLALALVAGVLTLPELILRVPELPNLTDDLEDGLSSEPNRPTLVRLLGALFEWRRARGPVVLLSGDVHLCGMSEAVEQRGEEVLRLPQVVASPIAHAPMPKVAEGFTTTTSEIVLEDHAERRLFARNVFYLSRRNFVEVRPGRLGRSGRGAPFSFHLEGHALPLEMPERF